MDLNFKNDIKFWLDNLEKLEPIPTEFCPNLRVDKPVKAIIFDIYGTLIISSSGDIDQASMTIDNMKEALKAGGFNSNDIKDIFVICGSVSFFLSIFTILGGIMAFKKQMWGLALTGGILGLFTIGPLFVSSILSLIGIILVFISKKEFQ